MTGIYDYTLMPNRVDVACPACRGRAEFRFVETHCIHRRSDIDFFRTNPAFEYRHVREAGVDEHVALFYPGLHADPHQALRNLPEGYTAVCFLPPAHEAPRHRLDLGSVRCGRCGLLRKHELDWPAEAYYAAQYKGRLLWAYDRESALALHDYLLSTRRDPGTSVWKLFLLRIPALFKSAKARDTVTRLLARRLAE